MGSVGLKINQGAGSFDLSGLFKSAIDPDQVIRAEQAKADIWNKYYLNQKYQADTEYARQQGLQEAQKTADLKTRADALGIAAPAYGDILANAVPEVPMPVPVTFPPLGPDPSRNPDHPNAFAGAMPGIVPPVNYDARTKQRLVDQENWRKIAPAIVQSSTTAVDLAGGLGKGLGEVGLSAPSTPEAARRSAILYTGNLPSKDTVVTAGDYAGTDAAARQAIQEAAGKPVIIDNQAYMLQPDGSYKKIAGIDQPPLFGGDVGKAREIVARGNALGGRDKLSPEGRAIYDAAMQQVTAADTKEVSKGASLVTATPTGVVPTPGSPPPAPEDTGMMAGLSNNDAAFLRKMIDVSVKMRSDPNYVPDEQTLQEFDTGNTQVFLQGKTYTEPSKVRIPEAGIEIGDPVKVDITPKLVPSLVSPQELYARAGKPYPGGAAAPAVATTSPAVVAPPVAPATSNDPLAALAATGGIAPTVGGIVSGPGGFSVAPGQAAPPAAAPANAPIGPVVAPNAAAAVNGQARTVNNQPVDVGPAASAFRDGGVYVQKIANGSGTPATEAEGKLRGYGGRAVFGTAYLDQIVGGKDIPDFLTLYFNNPANGDLTSEYVQSIADPGTKNYMAFATWFITAVLRKDSGAAITRDEFLMYREFLPRPGDNPAMLRARQEARHQFIRETFADGYTTDTRGRIAAEEDARQFNVKLAPDYGSIPATPEMTDLQAATERASAGKPPPGFLEAGHTLQDWIDLGRDGRAQFNALGPKGP